MADSMFNIYNKLKEETAAPRQVAMDYSKIPEGRVAAAVMAQTAGMLGGQVMEAAGYQNATQMQAQAMNEVKALYPNPKTRQEFIGMANEFKNRGMMDLWEKVMDQVDNMAGGADQKKWESDKEAHKQAIRDYALSKNYRLTERQLDNLVSSTDQKPSMHPTMAQQISGWRDIVDAALSRLKPNVKPNVKPDDTSVEDDTSDKDVSSAFVPTGATPFAKQKLLQKMSDDLRSETKDYRSDLEGANDGIAYINMHRQGNLSVLPNITKILAQMENDNRLSQPEVQHAMKFGGIFDRVSKSLSTWTSGKLPVEALDDIEKLFQLVGSVAEDRISEKRGEYRRRNTAFSTKDMELWVPKLQRQYISLQQKIDRAKEEMKKRGL